MSFIDKVTKIFSKVSPTSTDLNPNGLTDSQTPSVPLRMDGTSQTVNPIDFSTKITKDFSWGEVLKSQTAERLGIDNIPNEETANRIKHLFKTLVQPIRSAIKRPVVIRSGYRCPELNSQIGGSATSQHMTGEAVDMECIGLDNYDLAQYILAMGLEFDQLILEFYEGGNTGWLHISRKASGNRRQVLTINKGGTYEGLKKY